MLQVYSLPQIYWDADIKKEKKKKLHPTEAEHREPSHAYSWPQSAITTLALVLPDFSPTASTAWTTFMPSTTEPNTTCFPFNLEGGGVK